MSMVATKPGERRAREKEELRRQILNVARELFAEMGYEKVTMRDVAGRIGYTATALYYHFPDKHSLIMALCDRDFASLSESLRQLRQLADPVERIVKMSGAYVEFGIQNPHHYRLMFMTNHLTANDTENGGPNGLANGHGKNHPDHDAWEFVKQSVEEAINNGRLRDELNDPHLLTQIILAGLHGIVSLHLTKGGDEWFNWRAPAQAAAIQSEIFIRGILKDSGMGFPA